MCVCIYTFVYVICADGRTMTRVVVWMRPLHSGARNYFFRALVYSLDRTDVVRSYAMHVIIYDKNANGHPCRWTFRGDLSTRFIIMILLPFVFRVFDRRKTAYGRRYSLTKLRGQSTFILSRDRRLFVIPTLCILSYYNSSIHVL